MRVESTLRGATVGRPAIAWLACSIIAAATGCESVSGLDDLEFVGTGGAGPAAQASTSIASSSSGGQDSSATTSAGGGAPSSSSSTTSASGGGGVTYRDMVLGDDPVGYWRMGEAPGELLAADELGTSPGVYLDGEGETALGEAGAIAGDPDHAASFEGGARLFVEDADPFRFTGDAPFSVELWARWDRDEATQHQPIRCHDEDVHAGWILYFSGEGVFFKRYGTIDGETASEEAPTVGLVHDGAEFAHVVVTFDASQIARIYVNGTGGSTSEPMLVSIGEHSSGVIGGDPGPTADAPPIHLDEIALYDHALPADVVEAHYFCGRLGACDP
jgi:hypothetical protein